MRREHYSELPSLMVKIGTHSDEANYPCDLTLDQRSPSSTGELSHSNYRKCSHAVHQRPLHFFDGAKLKLGDKNFRTHDAPSVGAVKGADGQEALRVLGAELESGGVDVVQEHAKRTTHRFRPDGGYALELDPTRAIHAPRAAGLFAGGRRVVIGTTEYAAPLDEDIHVNMPRGDTGLAVEGRHSRILLGSDGLLRMRGVNGKEDTLDRDRFRRLINIADGIDALPLETVRVTGVAKVGAYAASDYHTTPYLRTPGVQLRNWRMRSVGDDLRISTSGGRGSVSFERGSRAQLGLGKVCTGRGSCLTGAQLLKLRGTKPTVLKTGGYYAAYLPAAKQPALFPPYPHLRRFAQWDVKPVKPV